MSFLGKLEAVAQSKHKKQVLSRSGPAVYVGTYAKYNQGDLTGKWLYLDDYSSYVDFLKAALEIHADEKDPELMFQDFEGFPKRYYHESSLDEALWDWLELDENDRNLLEVYIDEVNDEKATIDDAREAFAGTYKSKEYWAAEFIDDVGLTDDEKVAFVMISDLDAHLHALDSVSSTVDDLNADIEAERYSNVFSRTDLNEDEYDELVDKLMSEEDEDEQEQIKKEIEKLARKTVEQWESQEVDEIENRIKHDPVSYFTDELGYSIKDLLAQPFIQIDYKAYARDAEISGDYSFAHKDGEVWVFRNH